MIDNHPSDLPPDPPKPVTVAMKQDEAELLSHGISDILCWLSGWNAARSGTDLDGDGPYGINRLRDFNIKLKSAL